jgi:hypothetical protein
MLILGNIAGSYNLTDILQAGDAIRASEWYLPALILILLGAFTKSAQFPFHFWLPHAMAAPTPVSAYLHSATMVKAGVFLMARMWPVLAGTDAWFYIVATTGLVTMVLGALIALFKDDLKALLAFSTVSHLGLLTMLLGFGTQAAAVAAVFHIINHLTFKAALFMTAGIVDHETHTRDIKRLGGLRHLMPITFLIGTVAALSMAGIPLFNGFLSKEMMLEEASHTDWREALRRAGPRHARRAPVGGLFVPLRLPRLPRPGARRLSAQAPRSALRHVGRARVAGGAGDRHRRRAVPCRGDRDGGGQRRDRRRPAPASEDLARGDARAVDVGDRRLSAGGPADAARPLDKGVDRAPRPEAKVIFDRLVTALVA